MESFSDLLPLAAGDFESKYELGEGLLGSRGGREPRVWKATSRTASSPGQEVAVKLLPETTMAAREVSLLRAAQGHPNLLRLHGLYRAPAHVAEEESTGQVMVTEYCVGGSLSWDLNVGGAFGWQDAAMLSHCLLQALEHIHAVGIVHRDIQPANLMLRGDGLAVLTGFAFATSMEEEEELQKRCGAPGFAAPEVIAGLGCSALSDMFSAGCTIFCALSGTGSPFADADAARAIVNTLRKKVKFVGSREIESLSSEGKAFIGRLLDKKPAQRDTAAQALQHPWLQKSMLLG